MVREISSGGVVVRNKDGEWWMAAIELPEGPATAPATTKRTVRPKEKAVLCLPKGLVDPGEKALEAALREVREETGITASVVTKLADIKYVYVRSWGDGERVFKIVSFYLLRYESGRIDNISEDMRIEVARDGAGAKAMLREMGVPLREEARHSLRDVFRDASHPPGIGRR